MKGMMNSLNGYDQKEESLDIVNERKSDSEKQNRKELEAKICR